MKYTYNSWPYLGHAAVLKQKAVFFLHWYVTSVAVNLSPSRRFISVAMPFSPLDGLFCLLLFQMHFHKDRNKQKEKVVSDTRENTALSKSIEHLCVSKGLFLKEWESILWFVHKKYNILTTHFHLFIPIAESWKKLIFLSIESQFPCFTFTIIFLYIKSCVTSLDINNWRQARDEFVHTGSSPGGRLFWCIWHLLIFMSSFFMLFFSFFYPVSNWCCMQILCHSFGADIPLKMNGCHRIDVC